MSSFQRRKCKWPINNLFKVFNIHRQQGNTIKGALRFHLTPSGAATLKKAKHDRCWRGFGQRPLPYLLPGKQKLSLAWLRDPCRNRSLQENDVRTKTRCIWTWSVRLEQNLERVGFHGFSSLRQLHTVKLRWGESLSDNSHNQASGMATSKFPRKEASTWDLYSKKEFYWLTNRTWARA